MLPVIDDDRVPGRSWIRLAAVLSVVVLLVVAVIVAISLRRGADGGTDPGAADPRGVGSQGRSDVPSSTLEDVSAAAFDPLGTDGAENDAQAPLAVDGDDATTWDTQAYNDQLGPPPAGLKTGVGLVLDLDGEQPVTGVDLTFVGAPTEVSLYLFDRSPTSVAGLEATAKGRAKGTSTSLTLREPVQAAYAVIWLTSLPADGSLFKARIAEVAVQAETTP